MTEWPLTAAAVLFLGFYAWSVLADLQGPQEELAQSVIIATWAMFAVDYFTRLALADRRLRWLDGTCWTWPSSRYPFSGR